MPQSKTDMPLSDAIAYADRMRNSFRAFEKLGEVLTLASQAESRERQANQTTERLEKGIKGLIGKESALKQAIDNLDAKYNADMKEQQVAHGLRMRTLKDQTDHAQSAYAAKLKELESRLDSERASKQTAIRSLEVEETRLENVTGRLRQELQQLKSRIPDMA